MKISLHVQPSRLKFRFPFRIAHGERTGTDVVLLRLDCNGHSGFGEATLPPYLTDTIDSVLHFFKGMEVQNLVFPFTPEKISKEMDAHCIGAMPAKAALDMALWQLYLKLNNIRVATALQIPEAKEVLRSFTIGVGSFEEMKQKIAFGQSCGFHFFKLKMDGIHDEEILNHYKELTDLPFAVDVNQGWKNIQHAVAFARKLEDNGCVLVEQPFDKSDILNSEELTKSIGMPVIADEACQTIFDLEKMGHSFSGINIKLQKCGGITPALKMIHEAKQRGLKILIGCMSESSIGCGAAEVLTPFCDWADLDGPYLISNDKEIVVMAQHML